MAGVVIIGAGQGGLQVAMSLRQQAFEGEITLVGDEPGLPYERPPLSKAFMKDGDDAALALRPADWFERNRVALRPQTRIASIERAARRVVTEDGEALGYDHLVIATGARNVRPPISELNLAGVHDLRGLADARALRGAMHAARRAVVVGGGFIGLEFAAVARASGLDVTVVEMADRLMARVVSPPISARFLDAHRAAGVDVRLGAAVAALEGDGTVRAARLSDGSTIDCDLVLIATGVQPNAELAADAGLETDDGIVVDAELRTSDPAIWALGDVAAFPGPHGSHVRLESVQAATDHARHIACAIRDPGAADTYRSVPWFWSDQADLKLQIAGLAQAADAHVGRPGSGPVETVLSFAGGKLVAAETVNQPLVHMAARKLLARPEIPSHSDLARFDFDLRAFAKGGG